MTTSDEIIEFMKRVDITGEKETFLISEISAQTIELMKIVTGIIVSRQDSITIKRDLRFEAIEMSGMKETKVEMVDTE
jgi:hypothetical protein